MSIYRSPIVMLTALLVTAGLRAGQQTPAAPSDTAFTVDTVADLDDPNTSDGVCPVGSCSLRAAIMQANVMTTPGVTIIVPAGTYNLTRPRAGADGPDTSIGPEQGIPGFKAIQQERSLILIFIEIIIYPICKGIQ